MLRRYPACFESRTAAARAAAFLLLCLCPLWAGAAPVPCNTPPADAGWVQSAIVRANANNPLVAALSGRFKEPMLCRGQVLERVGNEVYGRLRLQWMGGVSIELEQAPPDAVRIEIKGPSNAMSEFGWRDLINGYMDRLQVPLQIPEFSAVQPGVLERFESSDPEAQGSVEFTTDISGRLNKIVINLR